MQIEKIREIEKREFGFMFEDRLDPRKIKMVRYKMFLLQAELERYIRENQPAHCFVSTAYYSTSFDMKGWTGADLFFDGDYEKNLILPRADAETIYEALLDDFALKDVTLNFSGSKGYHVIAFDEASRCLDGRARREIVDYMVGRYRVETIDAPASCDVRRLRRITGTINSKSGKYCEVIKTIRGGRDGKRQG